ncbi:MAG TPA: pyrroline-5-carboxylate reductase [Candidatus Binatia bacterium]|nr:pyrroline-5-carboxylate reductase [Candidatus Binatia bacterium]
MTTIGFVGAGNMARALGGGLRAGFERDAGETGTVRLLATDPDAGACERFRAETGGEPVADFAALARAADTLVLAVKPQVMPAVLADLARVLEARHLVISIAAGIPLAALARGLGSATRAVRAMPNTPALVRRGMTVLVPAATATGADVALAERIFRCVGDAVVVDDEGMLDAVTAVSGSGPGFFFAYAEAMLRAGEAAGLPPETALRLVRQTLLGSAALWVESGEPVEKLRAMVTSPGGTTQAGLAALEASGFAAAVGAAVAAATRRSRELSGV